MKVSFLLKKSKKRDNLTMPLFCRIKADGKTTEIFLKYHLLEEEWNGIQKRVSDKCPKAKLINARIAELEREIFRIAADLRLCGRKIDLTNIKSILSGNQIKQMSLIELFTLHNDNIKSRLNNDYSEPTLQKYELTKRKISLFLQYKIKKDDIDLNELKSSFLEEFETFLKSKQRLQHNTAMKHIKNVKKIVRLAVSKDLIKKNPFEHFRCTTKDVVRDCLTQEEISQIINKTSLNERLSVVRDLFAFSCFTGLSYADLDKLNLKHIQQSTSHGLRVIRIRRTKTGVESVIPILPQAEKLIEKYKEFSEYNNGKIFPVKSNQKMNEYLKEIETLCNLKKRVTFHLARHTFATTIALKNGVTMEAVKSILGHKNIRTTQIYAKMVDTRLVQEMQSLSNNLNNIDLI